MSIDGLIGYAALFTKAENEQYFVEFPDLPGCYTQGNTLEEAILYAQGALAIYYAEKKGELPTASTLESIQNKNPNSVVQIVVIDAASYIVKPLRTIKKTLTIPEWLNELGEKYQVNFSQILKTALISYLNNLDSLSPYDRKMLNN
jgi:predicted RNase H-like HicB family nuclease